MRKLVPCSIHPSRNGFSHLIILLGLRYENYGGRCIRRQQESLKRSDSGSDDDLCEAERILHPWHVVEENNNGTIVDIKTKNIYHQDDYRVIDIDGEEAFVVCDGGNEAVGELIYFDSVQLVLSNVLTSVSLVCLFLHILIHSSLKKLRHKEI